MENIYEIIGKLLAAAFVAMLAYLVPKAKTWLEANADRATNESIQQLVRVFARAAEQLFHDSDPSGTTRKEFVLSQLRVVGVEITEAIMNMIEGEVWAINTENKKAQVQAVALDELAVGTIEAAEGPSNE